MGFLSAFFLSSIFAVTPPPALPSVDPEVIAKMCAKKLNIPYGSDNITDAEFKKFKYCVGKYLK